MANARTPTNTRALQSYSSLVEVKEDFADQWKIMCTDDQGNMQHPIVKLTEALGSTEKKMAFAKAILPLLNKANPDFSARITQTVDPNRVRDTSVGDAGITHALSLGGKEQHERFLARFAKS